MENKNIVGDNRMIADFMGYIHSKHIEFDVHEMENLKYHCDWNVLMPVVERIEKERAVSVITNNWNNDGLYQCLIYWCFDLEMNNTRQKIVDISGEVKIEVVYRSVIKYIEWHNEQSKAQ